MASRKELVEAAKDLNKVLDADPPIDVEAGVDEIKKTILEAASLLTDADVIEGNTRKMIDELKAPAPAAKAKPDKVSAPKSEPKSTIKSKKVSAKVEKVSEKKTVGKPREKSARATGKEAKAKDAFRPLREGTIRANIFALMDGTKTVDQIADKLKVDRANCHAHVYCLWRDCGLGFSYDAERRVTGVLPKGVRSAFRETQAVSGKAA